jgi:hypothetical protein
VGQPAIQTLFDRVAWRIDEVIEKLENEVVPCIRNREVLCKYFEETFILTVFRSCFELEEILELLNLNIEEIRIVNRQLARCKAKPARAFFCISQGTRNLE